MKQAKWNQKPMETKPFWQTIFCTSEHIASFIVSLLDYLGYFSQLGKLWSLCA